MKKVILVLSALLFLNCAEQDFDYDYDQEVYEYNSNYYEEGDMALRPDTETEYIGRIKAADTDYPYGSGQDETTAGANDGTPKLAIGRNDVYGLCQGLLQKAGIIPDGVIDVADGQYREAFDTMPISITQLIEGSTLITSGIHQLLFNNTLISYTNTSTGASSTINEDFLYNFSAAGAAYTLQQALTGGGVKFDGTTPGTAVTTRRNSFALDVADFTVDANGFTFYPGPTSLTLTGIPNPAVIQHLFVDMDDGTNRELCTVNARPLAIGTPVADEKLTNIQCKVSGLAGFVPTSATLYIDYDPSSVD